MSAAVESKKAAPVTATMDQAPVVATGPCEYSASDIRRYGQSAFPADLVWAYFLPAAPTSASDVLVALAQSTSWSISQQSRKKRVNERLREWRIGKDSTLPLISSAEQMREMLAKTETGRYAAGPLRLGPSNILEVTPIVEKQFVIDLDATDYKEVRAVCGCGGTKFKMCSTCIEVIRVVARLIVDILEQLYRFERVHCLFSGGRGIHIRVLDYQVCCATTEVRTEIADTIQTALDEPGFTEICAPLRRLSERLKLPQPILPTIDRDVTTQMKKLTRGPFSVHQLTGRFCIPIESPEAFVSVEAISPTIHEVLAASAAKGKPDPRWAKALALMEKWTTIT